MPSTHLYEFAADDLSGGGVGVTFVAWDPGDELTALPGRGALQVKDRGR